VSPYLNKGHIGCNVTRKKKSAYTHAFLITSILFSAKAVGSRSLHIVI
jgi:hypothetical protein